MADGREPAGLGVDHVLELVAAARQLCQLLSSDIPKLSMGSRTGTRRG
jgi:hypothetical protein